MSNEIQRKPRVLVIDDEDINRLMACEALRQSGLDVVETADGERGVALFEARPFDLVLLDVVMPGMNGFEACRRMRQVLGRERVPIVMMTGRDDVAAITDAYEAGATDFIAKPLNFTLLGFRARYLLRTAQTANALVAREHEVASAERVAQLGHFRWSLDGGQLTCSPLVSAWLGLPAAGVMRDVEALFTRVAPEARKTLREHYAACLKNGGSFALDFRLDAADGVRYLHHEVEVTLDEDGDADAVFGILQDVSALKIARTEALRRAHYDLQTGVLNRSGFLLKLDRLLEQEPFGVAAVFALDLDDFKRVNAVLGPAQGDRILAEVASRLKGALADICEQAFVGRTGEDEFACAVVFAVEPGPARFANLDLDRVVSAAVLPPSALSEGTLRARLQSMLTALRDCLRVPFDMADHTIDLSASIGIGVQPLEQSAQAVDVFGRASMAMHHAKALGAGHAAFSEAAFAAAARAKHVREREVRTALRDDALHLSYQPKFCARTGKLVGAEALARWDGEANCGVTPEDFMAVAEAQGLMEQIGKRLFAGACEEVAAWQATPLARLKVAMNLSPVEFEDAGLVERLLCTIRSSGLEPTLFEFEITERLLMRDVHQAVRLMQALRELGASIAIDDFGTGYSSLAWLKDFPADTLKVGRSLVERLGNNDRTEVLLAGLVELGHRMQMRVVAEGMEDAAQLAAVCELGFDEVQGFVLGRPLPAPAFVTWAEQWRSDQFSALLASTRSRSGCTSAERARSTMESLKLGT